MLLVALHWQEPFDNETACRIDHAADSNFTVHATYFTLAVDAANEVDTAVSPETTYDYKRVFRDRFSTEPCAINVKNVSSQY